LNVKERSQFEKHIASAYSQIPDAKVGINMDKKILEIISLFRFTSLKLKQLTAHCGYAKNVKNY